MNFFFIYMYIIVMFSIMLYLLPSMKPLLSFSKFKNLKTFDYMTGFELYWIFLTPITLMFLINFSWMNYATSAWFGHLIFSSFQNKIIYLIFFFFLITMTLYSISFYFSSKEMFDYFIVIYNLLFWMLFLFCANTLFTVIFFIEMMSTLIFLLIMTSTFSNTYFYNNLNLTIHNYFNNTTPFFFVQMLLSFFWMSLMSSLNLFLSLMLFYLKFLTFDWFLFEYLFLFMMNVNQLKDILFFLFIWFNFLFCIFLKCGLVPFYFWKPVFFKGMPLHALFFYISFFYFFLFFFILYFFMIYVNEIFFFFLNLNIMILCVGFVMFFSILCESYYMKTFLAISSMINTLFVFLTLNTTNFLDFFFF